MVFSSLLFLYAFLPLFLAFYYAAPRRWRNGVAVFFSVVFYAWGEPVFVGVLLLASLVVYGVSLAMDRRPPAARGQRRALLALGLTATLGLLAYCKYSNFLVAQLNGVLGWVKHGGVVWTQVALPIGISFFTFQKVSYLVDVYRGTSRPARNLVNFLLFVMLFPQLIAGPIVRYHDIEDQLERREHTLDRFLAGLWRFLLGLGRKVLIANPLGQVADRIFELDIATLPMAHSWIGILCFAFQIYFDFAGYSDMAIGLARMMGFEFIENFDRPYTARTVTEFWRRWHISLSNFMRDYLYIPLGGNRGAPFRTGLNLWLVFLASGLWHGASWNFIFWGACHGALLSVEKAVGLERLKRIPAAMGNLLTFLLVILAWIPFKEGLDGRGLGQAAAYAGRLVAWRSWLPAGFEFDFDLPKLLSHRAAAALLFAAAISFIPDRFWKRRCWDDPLPAVPAAAWTRAAFAAACLILVSAALAGQGYNPFIYQRF